MKGMTWAAICLAPFFAASFAAEARDGFVLALDVANKPIEDTLTKIDQAARLGATHLNIPVLICQDNVNSSEVRWCHSFVSDAVNAGPAGPAAASQPAYRKTLTGIAETVRKRGFTIGVFPFLLSDDGQWRGFFKPMDFKAWAASYLAHLLDLADWAKSVGAIEMIAGSELNHLYMAEGAKAQGVRNRYWTDALNALRERLGPEVAVFIVANWDQWNLIPFWKASDRIGLSAYYPLAYRKESDESIELLSKNWREWADKLLGLSRSEDRPLYFSEVGYASMSGAAHEPWRFAPPTALNLELQARLYEAFKNTWATPTGETKKYSDALSRFMLWALTTSKAPLEDRGFTVIGKPAEGPLSQAFSQRRN